ncbi:hypothetical protein Ciccas_010760 [Cichlidogyrus casuarinus]|uniref:Uncharacterized protein n=1 Tax=Cichlidogyrus casuarinus TaxID=1844966 RepID=A0ABD2PUC9_9PLAT
MGPKFAFIRLNPMANEEQRFPEEFRDIFDALKAVHDRVPQEAESLSEEFCRTLNEQVRTVNSTEFTDVPIQDIIQYSLVICMRELLTQLGAVAQAYVESTENLSLAIEVIKDFLKLFCEKLEGLSDTLNGTATIFNFETDPFLGYLNELYITNLDSSIADLMSTIIDKLNACIILKEEIKKKYRLQSSATIEDLLVVVVKKVTTRRVPRLGGSVMMDQVLH